MILLTIFLLFSNQTEHDHADNFHFVTKLLAIFEKFQHDHIPLNAKGNWGSMSLRAKLVTRIVDTKMLNFYFCFVDV